MTGFGTRFAPLKMGRTATLLAWALVPLIALGMLCWSGWSRSSGISEIPLSDAGGGKALVASLSCPASIPADGRPVLVLYPEQAAPAGMLPLLDDLARAGACAMSCPLPAMPDASILQNAVDLLAEKAGVTAGRIWLLAYRDAARIVLNDPALASVAGWTLLDPGPDFFSPADDPPALPTGIFATGGDAEKRDGTLYEFFEALSGEDTTLAPPSESEGPTRSMTYVSADGDTRLTFYPGIPTGLGLMSPVLRDDLARWMGTSEPDGRLGRPGFLLLPFDATVLFVAGALMAVLVFGSLARLFPEGTLPRQDITRVGLLSAGALLLVCVTFGLVGRMLWSRPLIRWEPVAAGVAVLLFRIVVFGFLSLPRGWSGAVDRFVSRGLDAVDLLVCGAAASTVVLLTGGGFFAWTAATTASLCAWGYSRAVGGLSGSLLFSHLAAAVVLAVML
ncbi:MAG: hypothetical protein GX153_08610 [Clostridiaceae bacterium]|nr:hypothetical protein [Clostridiaceae bacterium]